MFESFLNSVQLTNNGVYYYSANVAAVNEWQNHLIFYVSKKISFKITKTHSFVRFVCSLYCMLRKMLAIVEKRHFGIIWTE